MGLVPSAGVRVRLVRSVRLQWLQAGFMLAAIGAAWLIIAPRLGALAAGCGAAAIAAWLAWRAGIDSQRGPDCLILHEDGQVYRLAGTGLPRVGRPAGLLQWPGLLALDLQYDDGGAETVLALSDGLEAPAFRTLAAWGRRHAQRGLA